jgi:hypothetical protein
VRVAPSAADAFLPAWRSAGGSESAWHPFWDLLESADSVPDLGPRAFGDAGAVLERFEDFVERVLGELA